MVISTDAEKAFAKIQHSFMIKTLQKMGIEGTYLNIYDKLTANIILSGENWKHSKIRNKTRVSTFTTIFQHSSGSPSYSNQRRKRNKRNPVRREEVKLSLFADDMTLYIENPKETLKIVSENY